MKWCYAIKMPDGLHIAIADLQPSIRMADTWYMPRINVPRGFRGKGYASELLGMVLADADAERQSIDLVVSPSDGLNRPQLMAWYRRHGFVQGSDSWFVRSPK